MDKTPEPDWDPTAEEVLHDQRAAYDKMREQCPVAYSESMQWSIFRHEDVVRILHDPETFSNTVSQHLSVPNGMDPPEHSAYRRIIEPYFSPERMTAFEPVCREIARNLIQKIFLSEEPEFIADFALPFAVQVQCAFLKWPPTLHEQLIRWTKRNADATRARDRKTMSEIADEFEQLIDEMLAIRAAHTSETSSAGDVMATLMNEQVHGRSLHNKEIASILRNWTVGEIGTISASIGILADYLAQHPDLQTQLRNHPTQLPAAIDEILRIHGPLVASRRITTRPVEIAGRHIPQGARISINWMSANRDGRVFEAPDTFRLDRDPSQNLLYGQGIHVCPGAPLARMEMRVCMEELLQKTTTIAPIPNTPPIKAHYPASGYSHLRLKCKTN